VLRTYWPLILILVGLGKMWDATQAQSNLHGPLFLIGSTGRRTPVVIVIVLLLWRGHGFADRADHHLSHISEIAKKLEKGNKPLKRSSKCPRAN